MDTPEIVVPLFFAFGHFEGGDANALWIHPRHHVTDHAVLPGGIDSLEYDQNAPLRFGVEQVLQYRQSFNALLQSRDTSRFINAVGFFSVEVVEMEFGRGRMDEYFR